MFNIVYGLYNNNHKSMQGPRVLPGYSPLQEVANQSQQGHHRHPLKVTFYTPLQGEAAQTLFIHWDWNYVITHFAQQYRNNTSMLDAIFVSGTNKEACHFCSFTSTQTTMLHCPMLSIKE